MEQNGMPTVCENGDELVVLEIAAQGHKGTCAVIHDDMTAFRGSHEAFQQVVKLPWINVGPLHDLDTVDIKLLKALQSGVHRICVIGNDRSAVFFAQFSQSLVQHACDHALAYAALALEYEMNLCHKPS